VNQPIRPVPTQHEHEFEAAPGLPEALPPGERVLWQGAPDPWRLAQEAFHLRGICVYFALMLALRGAYVWSDTSSAAGALVAMLWLLPAAVFAVGMLLYLAHLSARTTAYTLTNRRIVMRVGIALTLTFNLPLRRLAGAGLKLHAASGTGDIPLTLPAGDKIAYTHLWPHARPWRVARPEPMLRCVPDADRVARLLAQAWAAQTGSSVQALPQVAQPAPAHGSAHHAQPA
jgi:hypothetical protein